MATPPKPDFAAAKAPLRLPASIRMSPEVYFDRELARMVQKPVGKVTGTSAQGDRIVLKADVDGEAVEFIQRHTETLPRDAVIGVPIVASHGTWAVTDSRKFLLELYENQRPLTQKDKQALTRVFNAPEPKPVADYQSSPEFKAFMRMESEYGQPKKAPEPVE